VPTPYSLAGTPPQDHTQADDYQKNRPKVRPKRTGEDAQFREQPKSAYYDEYQTTTHLYSLLAGVAGFEPATNGFGDRCSTN
jgi:hypothetical protein